MNAMESIIINTTELKAFLFYYHRWLLSILSDFNREDMPEELFEGVLDNMITDDDLNFIYNVYRKVGKNKNKIKD